MKGAVDYDLLYRGRVLRCMGVLSDRMLHCNSDSCLSRGEAEMNQEELKLLEVRPKEAGWYFVSFYQYEKAEPEYPDYFKDWISFDGEKWDYDGYEGKCYVCFIHAKER